MDTLTLSIIIIAVVATVVVGYRFFKTKSTSLLIILGLVYASLFLGYKLTTGILAPIEFVKERDYRYKHVIESLKNIRKAEIAYKDEHGKFTGDFETLINFVKSDSVSVVRKLGTLPDTLNEALAAEIGLSIRKLPAVITKAQALKLGNVIIKEDVIVENNHKSLHIALKMGFLIRDTVKISVKDTLFGPKFNVDSLQYIPFSAKGAKFQLGAGEIETASKIKVQVFEAIDTDPFDPNKILKVGSLTEATNNSGNWE